MALQTMGSRTEYGPQCLKECFKAIKHMIPSCSYPYLVYDMSTRNQSHFMRLRTNIFPGPDGKITPIIFVPKEQKKLKK